MENISCVIKRHGHEEAYDERKLYASLYAAARMSHASESAAEAFAEKVVACVNAFLTQSHPSCVESHAIFRKAIECAKPTNADIAFMYETHRDIS